jgi:hypothetical protein
MDELVARAEQRVGDVGWRFGAHLFEDGARELHVLGGCLGPGRIANHGQSLHDLSFMTRLGGRRR